MKFSLRELFFAVIASGSLMSWVVQKPYLEYEAKQREAVLQVEIDRLTPKTVFIGTNAGFIGTPAGAILGYQASHTTQGNDNVFIGYR